VPKAPIFLYALESQNPYKKTTDEIKFELFKLNKSLWLGEMLPTYDLAIPFNSLFMKQTYPTNALCSKYLGKLNQSHYHQSALWSLVQQAVTQRSVPPGAAEEFRDSDGHACLSMKELASTVLYQSQPNIVLPYL